MHYLNETNENIHLSMKENESYCKNTNVNELIHNFNNIPKYQQQFKRIRTHSFNDDDNNTNYNDNSIKELTLICDYYNINISKMKKKDIINEINNFEFSYQNQFLVKERKRLWFYIETLKNDKYMKKFVLW